MYTHIYVYIYNIQIYINKCKYVRTVLNLYRAEHMGVYIHTYVYIYIYTYIHIHMFIHIFICTNVRLYTPF